MSLVTKADPSSRYLPNDVPRNRHIKKVTEISRTDPRYERYVLEPELQQQQAQALALFRRAWSDGGWCIYVDEEYYVEQELGLRQPVNTLLTQGRSKGISMVLAMQRPSWVSLFAISEPTHVIIFQLGHKDDVRRVTGATTEALAEPIRNLGRYEAIHYYRTENSYAVIDLDRITGKRSAEALAPA